MLSRIGMFAAASIACGAWLAASIIRCIPPGSAVTAG
jgi:hypothetical protein